MNRQRICLVSLVMLLILAGGCAKPTPAPTLTPTATTAPTITLTHTPTPSPTETATSTPAPTLTPTMCSVHHELTRTPRTQILQLSNKEVARQLPKTLSQEGVSLQQVSTDIHSHGVIVSVQVMLEGGAVLTATSTMSAKAEDNVIVLVPGEVHIEGSTDPFTESLVAAAFQKMLQDPQWTHIMSPIGRVLCVEMQEGHLLIAVLPHTPTPTNTPIPPKVLATMFPSNPVYGMRILARGDAVITPIASHDRDTQTLIGLDGTISFPRDYMGSVRDLLLSSLDPILTHGMVLRQKDEGKGVEEYCNCVMGVKLGDLTADVCWYGGKYGDKLEGWIFTRLNIIKPKVSEHFYQTLSDVDRLRQ